MDSPSLSNPPLEESKTPKDKTDQPYPLAIPKQYSERYGLSKTLRFYVTQVMLSTTLLFVFFDTDVIFPPVILDHLVTISSLTPAFLGHVLNGAVAFARDISIKSMKMNARQFLSYLPSYSDGLFEKIYNEIGIDPKIATQMTYPALMDNFYFVADGNRIPLMQRLAKFSVDRKELMIELERNCDHDIITIPDDDDVVEVPKRQETPPPQREDTPEKEKTPPPQRVFPLGNRNRAPPLPELVIDDLTQINERHPPPFEESQESNFPLARDVLDLLNDHPLTQVDPLTQVINLDRRFGGVPLPKGNRKRMLDQINEEEVDEVTLPPPPPKRRTPTPSCDSEDESVSSYTPSFSPPPQGVKVEKAKPNPRYFSSIVLKPNKRVYRPAPKAPLAMGKTGAFEGSITMMAPARRMAKGYKPLLPEAKILDSVANEWGPASTSKGTADAEKSSIYYAYSPGGRAGFSKGKWVNPKITVKREEGETDVTVKVDCSITINQLLPVDDIMLLIGQIFSAKTVQKVASVPDEEIVSDDEFDEVDQIE